MDVSTKIPSFEGGRKELVVGKRFVTGRTSFLSFRKPACKRGGCIKRKRRTWNSGGAKEGIKLERLAKAGIFLHKNGI